MKVISAAFLLCIHLSLFAQNPSILRIKGSSELSVKPTLTVVTYSIKSDNKTYSSAIEELARRVNSLTATLKKLNFSEKEILTSNFNINKNYNYVQGQRKETGYTATQNLVIQFAQSKDRLLEVLNSTTETEASPEIAISFKLDDMRKAKLKDELIKLAIKDAKTKAELIAGEMEYKITGIQEINYGTSQSTPGPLYSSARSAMNIEMAADVKLSNFEVSNLVFSEGIDMIYLITSK